MTGDRAVRVARSARKATPPIELLERWLINGGQDTEEFVTEVTAWERVPWLYRAVDVRSMAVGTMPRALYRGSKDVTNTKEGRRITGGMRRLLGLTESALCLFGQAYWLRETNVLGGNEQVRWALPSTMVPEVQNAAGLVGFKRTTEAGDVVLPLDRVIYFWQPSMTSEVAAGPGPASVALSAAGVLRSVDRFAEAYFKRGAINPTLLSVTDVEADDQELRGLEAWWKRLVGGVSRAWETVAVRSEIKPVTIGSSVKEAAAPELTAQKREDVATALGIPHTLLFSNAANYATAEQDALSFYERTVIPECEFIAECVNAQWLDKLGLELRFKPDELALMQEDEADRAQSLYNLTQAGVDLEIAMDLLGYELEDEQRAKLFPKPEPGAGEGQDQGQPAGQEPAEQPAEGGAVPVGQETRGAVMLPAPVVDELRQWLRKAAKRGGPVDFTCYATPAPIAERLAGALAGATSAADVRAVFAPFLTGKLDAFTPQGDTAILPAGPVRITEDDILAAIAEWDKVFPELSGLLEAEVENG